MVFDELQLADPGVRRALAPFLSGRRRVPVENEVVRIAPVALLTMNPGAGRPSRNGPAWRHPSSDG